MQEIFLSLIEQLNAAVFVLIAILALAFVLSFKAGALKQLFLNHANRIDNAERIADTVIELKTKVDLIYQHVNPNSPVRSASPISLTEVGQQIAENIKAEDLLKNYGKKLVDKVESQKPKNAYEIQQVAFEAAKNHFRELLKEEELLSIKEEAYQRGLLVEDVLSVVGVLLRNKILEEKNIPISDVDKHAKENN